MTNEYCPHCEHLLFRHAAKSGKCPACARAGRGCLGTTYTHTRITTDYLAKLHKLAEIEQRSQIKVLERLIDQRLEGWDELRRTFQGPVLTWCERCGFDHVSDRPYNHKPKPRPSLPKNSQ